jgi:2'-hydroxyisoflavone reductase
MSHTRRRFLATSAAAAASLAPGGSLLASDRRHTAAADTAPVAPPRPSPTRRPLRILILGGTGFIGPHQVRYAMYRGHEVTIFNRGRTAPDLFPGVEALVGDRDGQLGALEGRTWDAVIDNSGYVPRHVRDSVALLRDNVGRYLFTSTGSVYSFDQDEITEDGVLLPIEDPESEDVNRYYGPLKILCENAVTDGFRERGTVLRLHVVAGPGDTTDRFTYWPVRIDHGGEIIAPGSRNTPVQYIDVRDLAEFMVHLLEQETRGVYNVIGPEGDLHMEEFLYGIKAVTSTPSNLTFVTLDFLRDQGVRPWSDLPVWQPPVGPTAGFARMSRARGMAAGLRYRPLAVTAAETLEWWKELPEEDRMTMGAGLAPEREAEVLAAWHRRSG